LWRKLLYYVNREKFDRELDEEMRFHLEMKTEEYLAGGMTEEEARRAAHRQFGNETRLQEMSREMWDFGFLETLFQDVQYGVRLLAKQEVHCCCRAHTCSRDRRERQSLASLTPCYLTGLFFGLVPALKVSRVDLNDMLREGGRGSAGSLGRSRMRTLLVISEIALSLVLLVGAGLLIRSFVALLSTPPSYDPSRVLTATMELPLPNKPGLNFSSSKWLRVSERCRGVEAAGSTSLLPLTAMDTNVELKIEGLLQRNLEQRLLQDRMR
jgi:hypothetical protein